MGREDLKTCRAERFYAQFAIHDWPAWNKYIFVTLLKQNTLFIGLKSTKRYLYIVEATQTTHKTKIDSRIKKRRKQSAKEKMAPNR